MLNNGTKLGPYEIAGPLGAGGMGEVYRARDTRLGRDVAIKILPQHLTEKADARQRLEREARAVSALNHAHICTLYDVGHQDGTDYLVMEYLEGETLAQRLQKGALPTAELLQRAIEIADALEKAHRRGIVHRDLKPGNIMLTKAGAKLLDFGLAKPQGDAASPDLAATLTRGKPLTAEGTIVGTFQYMAPEQVEAKEADERSDIFSFGAVLYEIATGKKAFEGKSQASLIAAILSANPAPITALQPMAPPALERVVKTCLAKDPDERWQTAHDLKLQLQWIAEGGSQAGVPAPVAAKRKYRELIFGGVATLAILAAIFFAFLYFERAPQRLSLEASILSPEKTSFTLGSDDKSGPMVLSKDGKRIAFVAAEAQGNTHLYVRALDDTEARMIPGTEGAEYPFWAPDGESLGFFSNGKLRRVNASGGPPLDICDAVRPRGGSWGADDTILFAPYITAGIFRVNTTPGSVPVQVTKLSPEHTTNRWPTLLPDGKHFIYLASSHSNPYASAQNGIYFASLDGKENHFVVPSDTNSVYAHGYLLWVQNGSLLAAAFDPSTGRTSGETTALAADIGFNISTWRAAFDATDNGVLVYQSATGLGETKLVVFNRDGKPEQTISDVGTAVDVRFSPDGRRVAVFEERGAQGEDVWILDLDKGTRMPLTSGLGKVLAIQGVAWSTDGRELYYPVGIPDPTSNTKLTYRIVSKAVDGSGKEETVLKSQDRMFVSDVSSNGQDLLFEKAYGGLAATTWITSLTPGAKARPLLQEPVGTYSAGFSPDGKWVVYRSAESGRYELYAMSISQGGREQLTSTGATFWEWRGDGKAIDYTADDGSVYELPVSEAAGRLAASAPPHSLFKMGVPVTTSFFGRAWDATKDGQRFILATNGEQASGSAATIETNWPALLKKR